MSVCRECSETRARSEKQKESARNGYRRYRAAHLEEERVRLREYQRRNPEKSRGGYWKHRTHPVSKAVELRINLSVAQQSEEAWYWDIQSYFGSRRSAGFYKTCKEAWDAGRAELENLREAVAEFNKRLLEDYEQAK